MHLPPGARIHLIAACGTAMGSLAAMLRERGFRVSGSDSHVYPPMSTFLESIGVPVRQGFAVAHLEPAPDLVVVGNAVSRGNPEVEAMLDRRLPYLSLPEVLRDFFIRGRRSVVVTGTHGKTTTTALIAHLLVEGGLDPSFLVAGLPRNFAQPYRLGGGEHFVVEGDEYDSAFFAKWAKFFFYLPEVLILNNVEFDHADIYADLAEIEKAFRQLINTLPRSGLLLAGSGDPVVAGLLPASFAPVQTFGLEKDAFWRAVDIHMQAGHTAFSALCQGRPFGRFEVPMSGEYNVRNALAAMGAAARAGLSPEQIRQGLATFQGVRRRQELIGETGGIVLVDDFAHHPTAVARTLEGLRQVYAGRRLWVLFEPASATNARALFEERYLEAFAPADRLIVGKVPRPERARGDEPFSPERLVARIRALGREAEYLPDAEQIVASVAAQTLPGDVVVFMSNGGFGNAQRLLLQKLEERHGPSC